MAGIVYGSGKWARHYRVCLIANLEGRVASGNRAELVCVLGSIMAKTNKVLEVRAALGALGPVVPTLALISCVVNILALTGSFYMLQVYDRVLSSRSVETLVALSVLTIGLYVFQGFLEVIRAQIFVRIASRLDRKLAAKAHDAVMRLPLYGGSRAEALQPMRDVDTIRTFLAGAGPIALFDIPWMPLYIGFVFLLHPILGIVTLIGALFMLALTLTTEKLG